MTLTCVVTTIRAATASLNVLVEAVLRVGADLIVIGDRRGPPALDIAAGSDLTGNRLRFSSLEAQLASEFELARLLPVDHYSRKNIGYLQAIAGGAGSIYETDDDNAPLAHWRPRPETPEAVSVGAQGWLNAYQYFSDELIWPRGFPLDAVGSPPAGLPGSTEARLMHAPIQQGLADHAPDVDAVWRLVLDRPFTFRTGPSIRLAPGCWCPFNSQSTWWWPEAYALMYLPSHCSFRMTDIWRSFIAQRCLWELGHGVVFHPPEVIQERNPHDLMRDFADETVGYLRNRELAGILDRLELEAGPGSQGANLLACYRALVRANFFPREELVLVQAWLDELAGIRAAGSAEALAV